MTYVYAPETIIKAYSLGVFPMASAHDAQNIAFYEPEQRGILPLAPPHIPRRLLRLARNTRWEVTLNKDFYAVIHGCATLTHDRHESWINAEIKRLYLALHKMGFAHSVEVWEEGMLIGGLYGLVLGGAFFGESMFSQKSNASKLALAHLMARLYFADFKLLDAQFSSEHLRQFGLIEIEREAFKQQLAEALTHQTEFPQQASEAQIFAYLAQAKTVTS